MLADGRVIGIDAALHLAEGVLPSCMVGLSMVKGLVNPGKNALCGSALAFFDTVDELISFALQELYRTFET